MSRAGKTGLASGLTQCTCASELLLNLGCVMCVKEQTIQISHFIPPQKKTFLNIYCGLSL